MKLVFVSSTFKDMQFERDALHTHIEPMLDGELAPFGENAYFGDLRWGVNTTALDSEEGARCVLEVCLDEIDDCRPYMIVLIGERYGWIPEAELIRSAAEMKGVEIDGDISVTQLEIEYGALLDPASAGRVFFYFRELDKTGMTASELADYSAESATHREKIDALKERITAICPESVRTYTARWNADTHSVVGLDGFLDAVRDDLSRVILSDVAEDESLPWQERAMRSAGRYFLESSAHYCPVRREPLSFFNGTYSDSELRMRFIKGSAGTGKTAFISHAYRDNLEKHGEVGMLPFVLGLDKYSTYEMDYFKILLYEIEKLSGTPHYATEYGTEEPDPEVFSRIFSYEGLCTDVIHSYIDNCSYELQNTLSRRVLDTHLENCDFDYFNRRECSHENLDFFIAYSSGEPTVILPPWFDYSKTYILDEIGEDEVVPLVNTLLKSKHKELAPEVVSSITGKECSRLPTYLKLVVDRLLMLDSADFATIRGMGDGMENINRYQLSVIDRLPDTVEGMAHELIQKVAERVGEQTVCRTLALLVYSSARMSEGEICAAFASAGWEFNSLDFALATRALSSVIDYNPKDKSYRISNPEAVSAAQAVIDGAGYGYVAAALYAHIYALPATHRLREALYRTASYVGEEFLVAFYAQNHADKRLLSTGTDWLLKQRGADFTAKILTRVALDYPDLDFSFILERVPTACLTEEDHEPYCALLETILDNLYPTANAENGINCNTLAVIAWCKLVLVRMHVNTSDAAPLFHSFVDSGCAELPMTDRARVHFEITYLRFTANEAYYSMTTLNFEHSEIETFDLTGSDAFASNAEGLMYAAHLLSAFASYCDRSLCLEEAKMYRDMANKYYAALSEMLEDGDADIFTADDIAYMINTSLEDKGEYASIDHARLVVALDYMTMGQSLVDSRLNKYLPTILAAARFSYDDDGDPVDLYLRLCAYSRAVACGAGTLDDCVFAAIQMGYAADILSDYELGDTYPLLLWNLDRFIRIAITLSQCDPRTLYRLYMPAHYLMSRLEIYGMNDMLADFAAFLSSLDFVDEDAPLLPELFVGSLIYCYTDQQNDALRDRLRDIRDTVSTDADYESYASAYSPELMYIGVDIRTPEEIAEDNKMFTLSEDEDGDGDEDNGDGEGFADLDELESFLAEMGIDMDDLFNDDIDGTED